MPFLKTRWERSDELLGIAHSDVFGKVETIRGAEYFVTFIDDKPRFVCVYTLKHKSEVFEKFADWKSMVEKSSVMKIKVLKTNNRGKCTSKEFEQYLKKQGTQHELIAPQTSQQNGVAKCIHRILVETIRSMLADSELRKRFWTEALSIATYLRNRSPTNTVQDKTSYEVWTGNKPFVSPLRKFGCDTCVMYPKMKEASLI